MVLCLLASVGVAVAASITATPTYASTARLFVSGTQGDTSTQLEGAQLSAVRMSSYAEMIGARELADAVAYDIGDGTDPGSLSGKVSAEVVPDTYIIEITAETQTTSVRRYWPRPSPRPSSRSSTH